MWVGDRTVQRGCQYETIEVNDWHVEETETNLWHGTCRDAQGDEQSFGINVNFVWKPSMSET